MSLMRKYFRLQKQAELQQKQLQKSQVEATGYMDLALMTRDVSSQTQMIQKAIQCLDMYDDFWDQMCEVDMEIDRTEQELMSSGELNDELY